MAFGPFSINGIAPTPAMFRYKKYVLKKRVLKHDVLHGKAARAWTRSRSTIKPKDGSSEPETEENDELAGETQLSETSSLPEGATKLPLIPFEKVQTDVCT